MNTFYSNTKALNAEYLNIIKKHNGAETDRKDTWRRMNQSTAIFDGHVIWTGFIPKIFDEGALVRLNEIATTTYTIITKVMDRYFSDETYRNLFGYDKRMEELILLPRRIDSYIPFARIDLFLNEETGAATFCEFNADGSSGMNENRETFASIEPTSVYKEFASNHSVKDCNKTFFEGWVSEFIRLYRTYDKAVEHPHIAILDYLENSVLEEFKIYAALFEQAGYSCSIYDIRNCTYQEGKLVGHKPYLGKENAAIDAVWRRCVSNDILDHWDESAYFINAIKDDAVALIGSFAGHIIHDKRLFDVIQKPETFAFLTDEEVTFIKSTFPATLPLQTKELGADKLTEIKSDPYNWILKPPDGYCCRGVIPGPNFCESPAQHEEWANIIDNLIDSKSGVDYLVQRFCHPYETPAIAFYDKDEDYTKDALPYKNMEGLYLIDGKFSGVYTRLGPNPIILGKYGGITEAGVYVDADDLLEKLGWQN